MKKQLVSKTAAAVQALGIGLLFLISCTNILGPPPEWAGNGETGRVQISLGNGVGGARTLLPAEVTFERYDLTITAVAPNSASTVNHTISSGSSDTVELTAGGWEVHVDAYTDAEGQNKAAEGDSGTFTVSANATIPVSVALKALSGVGDGTLSVDITGEDGGVITYGYLRIYNGADFDDPVTFGSGSYTSTQASFSSGSLTLDIALPPGQYRVFAYIYNNEGQRVFINEVAWIYSNLTTPLERLIEAADFDDITTISGTVQYVENGVDQDSYTLHIYAEGSGHSLYDFGIYSDQSYIFRIPRPDKDVTLYIYISKGIGSFLADSINLTAGQTSAIKNISVNRSGITLSGTVTGTVAGGGAPDAIGVFASSEEGGLSFGSTGSNGEWMTSEMIPSDFSGTLNLHIVANYGGQVYRAYNVGSWTPGSPTTGITLNASFITVSGSFTATEDSTPVSGASVTIQAFRESDPESGEFNVFLGETSGSWAGNTCDWTLGITECSPQAEVQFRIIMDGNHYTTETVTVGASNITIPFRSYSFTTLSGTIGAVTVDGVTPSSILINARTSDGEYEGTIEDGVWRILVPGDFSGTLTIRVRVDYMEIRNQIDVKTWTSGTSPTGIDLGDVTLKLISGTVTTDGTSPLSSGEVYVFGPDGFPDFGSWPLGSAKITNGNFSDYAPGDLASGYVVVYDGGVNYYCTLEPVSIGSSMSFNLSTMHKESAPD
jgi:hypothetical protein